MSRALRVLGIGATMSIAAAAACVDVSTDPQAIGSIAFDSLPFPSIVAGESMRDSTGAEAPFRARVFNTQGDPIPDVAVQFISTDTLATVSDLGVLSVETFRDTPVSVFAVVGSLQARGPDVPIVRAPDTLRQTSSTIDTLVFDATTELRFSDTVSVQLSAVETSGLVPVPNWLVSYRVQHDGQDLPPGDSSVAFVVDLRGSASFVDTTDGSGRSDRALRVRRAPLASPLDSLIVFATARYRGAPVPGSPVRLVLYVRQP
jgi:hypothetical protein